MTKRNSKEKKKIKIKTIYITKDNLYPPYIQGRREEEKDEEVVLPTVEELLASDDLDEATVTREVYIDGELSIATSLNSDANLDPLILELAIKMKNNERFIGTETELKEECGRTRSRVKYIRPKPWERDRRVTQTRRRLMMKELKRHATKRHLKGLANKHIAHPLFKVAEAKMKDECRLTSGAKKVKYERPSPTDIAADTRVRRQGLRRKLHKYYEYLAEKSYSFAVAKTYAMLLAPASARRAVEESTKVDCLLGPKKCPCRGLKWDHIFFTWRRVDDGKKPIEDEVKKFWGQCPECKNGYDKRFGGKGMDIIVNDCTNIVNELQKAAEADADVFTSGEKLNLSPADILRGLIPKIRRLIDEGASEDGEKISDESAARGAATAKAKECMNEWLGKRHSKFLAFIKEDDEDFWAWLEASSMRFTPAQQGAK
jgi:hypothetical protein